ncbi:MAG TPA: hypothetical protein VGX76_21365 [Pirellulales bacterium]|nr:hypothetical protein [Pirellulales bacterium]
MRKYPFTIAAGIGLMLVGALAARSQEKQKAEEGERQVKQSEVPAAALAALKKLAGSAAITEFAEEIEHGHKFYEGSWKGPDGNIDALVTESGTVVEIEETMPEGKIPAEVRKAAEQEAGPHSDLTFERVTKYLYEIHYKKGGKSQEAVYTPDARRYQEPGANASKKVAEEDEDEEEEDDDDGK